MPDDADSILQRALRLRDRIARALDSLAEEKAAAATALDDLRAEEVARQLVAMPVERLREVTDDRLRIAPLRDAGFATVFDVYRASVEQLDAVPNIGETTAAQVLAAAQRLARTLLQATPVRLDPDRPTDRSTEALRRVDRYDRLRRAAAPVRREAAELNASLDAHLAVGRRASSTVRMLFTFGKRRRAVHDAIEALGALLATPAAVTVERQLTEVDSVLDAPAGTPTAAQLWQRYERDAATFGTVVERLTAERGGVTAPVTGAHGYVPEEIVARISAIELDDAYLKVALRGYQEFGAKFALVQGRAILGDEMGLGKTIQAIAALAHLQAQGHGHFLVVCPATVLVNWVHEIGRHSDLVAHRVHGDDRDRALATWETDGGVAVTTFETLRGLLVDSDDGDEVDGDDGDEGDAVGAARLARTAVAMVVVDEAHYVKNADARRSRAVQALVAGVERALFLTGTPMENRVEEFRTLVSYLRPDVAEVLDRSVGVAGADAFRRSVAPVYLRRNQDDVLDELPERIETEDWVELTPDDLVAYRDAVAAGNFMAMRRAAYVVRDVERSAKLGRLAQILADAAENGHKVLVFSYFLDVLDAVGELAGPDAHGPLTGAVPPVERQAIVDRFSATDGHAVLVSQIQAGGVGLNVQAASVVVLTEPQWKPSVEEQAIARAHRMGQTRVVQVHRLLAESSVDELVLDIVRRKRVLFDEFARESDLKDASVDAVDVSEAAAARRIIELERDRLGLPLPLPAGAVGEQHDPRGV